MAALTLTSCQAPNSEIVIDGLAAYLHRTLGEEALVQLGMPWQERHRLLDAGEIDIGWICSVPYVRNTERGTAAYDLLAAPVHSADRYRGLPVYFSDIVVRDDSRFRTFEDLRGARWGYNEEASFSGYVVAKAHLADLGERRFFGELIDAGSHERAMEMIVAGEIEGAAIDSTVFERQQVLDPASVAPLRIIGSLGPNLAPPLVISKSLDPYLRARIQQAVLAMHFDPAGRASLEEAQISRFANVTDDSYDPIRVAMGKAKAVVW